eukprot:6660236-Prymnesium_polylepis.1
MAGVAVRVAGEGELSVQHDLHVARVDLADAAAARDRRRALRPPVDRLGNVGDRDDDDGAREHHPADTRTVERRVARGDREG